MAAIEIKKYEKVTVIKKGVRQGRLIYPLLFNLFIKYSPRNVKI